VSDRQVAPHIALDAVYAFAEAADLDAYTYARQRIAAIAG
jgi:hypothetical protein